MADDGYLETQTCQAGSMSQLFWQSLAGQFINVAASNLKGSHYCNNATHAAQGVYINVIACKSKSMVLTLPVHRRRPVPGERGGRARRDGLAAVPAHHLTGAVAAPIWLIGAPCSSQALCTARFTASAGSARPQGGSSPTG
jgi:hypothetical protein